MSNYISTIVALDHLIYEEYCGFEHTSNLYREDEETIEKKSFIHNCSNPQTWTFQVHLTQLFLQLFDRPQVLAPIDELAIICQILVVKPFVRI